MLAVAKSRVPLVVPPPCEFLHLVTSSGVGLHPLLLVADIAPPLPHRSPAWTDGRVPRSGRSASTDWCGEVGEPMEESVSAWA
jgi:hypothetical protein